MSAAGKTRGAEASAASSAAGGNASDHARLSRGQLRQIAMITLGAVALYVGFRLLPTGTSLSHGDFRVEGAGGVEFCDPANPQFIPVVAMRSPVTMAVQTTNSAAAGEEVRGTIVLRTASGKPIAPVDLLVTHTRKLHLLIVDPTLQDYQHVHPEARADGAGEWTFAFTPLRAGPYRVFADFTPVATARGLYASADLEVAASSRAATSSGSNASAGATAGYNFTLVPAKPVVRIREPIDLTFAITRTDGAAVPLELVMGAYAHLVAFDKSRSGFAHLHPNETDLANPPDAHQPKLTFKVTFPNSGRYVIWAQTNLSGHESFVPFEVEVMQ